MGNVNFESGSENLEKKDSSLEEGREEEKMLALLYKRPNNFLNLIYDNIYFI